jgi:hypothetical protein
MAELLGTSRVMEEKGPKKKQIKFYLLPENIGPLKALEPQNGVKQSEGLDRILAWFFSQPETVRDAIIKRQSVRVSTDLSDGATLADMEALFMSAIRALDKITAKKKSRPPAAAIDILNPQSPKPESAARKDGADKTHVRPQRPK